ncbi:MAG: hypothetical protein FWC83_01100 [Alphaproteobacteria bacterium]|nr:hypothetical protein [Alphaproteobacteria bacterium]
MFPISKTAKEFKRAVGNGDACWAGKWIDRLVEIKAELEVIPNAEKHHERAVKVFAFEIDKLIKVLGRNYQLPVRDLREISPIFYRLEKSAAEFIKMAYLLAAREKSDRIAREKAEIINSISITQSGTHRVVS